jgi:hypothetical protein
MKCVVNIVAALVCGLAWSWVSSAAAAEEEKTPAAKPAVQEAAGIDRGSKTAMVIVARDEAAWNSALQAAGKAQMLPIGMPKGQDLAALGNIDFGKQMIVAVFWGEMSFSGHDEKCRIERVTVAGGELVVDCRATLWGGAVDAAYRAWPYHALVVDRSDLPVKFRQTTELKAMPDRTEKDKTLAIVQKTDWKQEFSAGK